ncbi:MAG TPA: ABC transporter permease [Anaerolineae bacterium]|nr:ABC transporter permease [Anaerolineae bacterium]HPL30461.1 ABC transporter permease [Anaerolineae bacterium]
MARYIIRRLSTMLLTMLLVSVVVFAIAEIAPGNVARNILGAYATPEQERSMEKQLGLHRPVATRYVSWLLGSDWQARSLVGLPLREIVISQGTVQGFHQWWAQDPEGNLAQWLVQGEHLIKLVRQKDGSVVKVPDDASWRTGADGSHYFWGIDTANHAALWVQGQGQVEYRLEYSGWIQSSDAPIDYVPLSKGLIRGDAGISLQYKRPVSEVIGRRIQNSGALAMLAFLVAMPLGVLLGLIAGLHEGKRLDRIISLGGLITTASPDFATGIILIMVFSLGLKWLPGATVFTTSGSPLLEPQKLILPVLTASLVEIGYILRITRASVVEVMNSGYVRTAILKGIPYRQVVLRHVLRNSLMAPVTVIMLHVNWLIGGLVVVESVFGYPGLGSFVLNAALYKDVYAIEAGAMVLIVLAVGTQLIADILYSYLNPRIRYS